MDDPGAGRDKKSIKNFDYWISYSYLDTKRDYLNYPEELEPNFAAHHTASIVMKRFVTKWKAGFNVTYSFATGRPYYNFLYDNNGSFFISLKPKSERKGDSDDENGQCDDALHDLLLLLVVTRHSFGF